MNTQTPNTGWHDRVHGALNETADAFRALWAAQANKAPTTALSSAAYAAAARSNKLQEECRDAFAKSRGWRFTKKPRPSLRSRKERADDAYGLYCRQIIRPEYFADKNGQTVGVVTHSGATLDEIGRYAARNGYAAEVLPFSWMDPAYTAVVLTLKAGASWWL